MKMKEKLDFPGLTTISPDEMKLIEGVWGRTGGRFYGVP
jgi:hypothetical protein